MEIRLNRVFLRATTSGFLPKYSGGIVRGMVFNALDNLDKHLSKEVHDHDGIKKYSLSNLRLFISPNDPLSVMQKTIGKKHRRRDNKINAGDILYFDVVTTLNELQNALPQLMEQSWEADKSGIELKPLQIRGADIDKIMKTDLPAVIPVHFVSPLSFTKGPTYSVWPEPVDLIKNLVSIWNTWFETSPLDPDIIIEKYVPKVRVQYADGKVLTANAATNVSHSGWVGRVNYATDDEDSHEVFSNLLKLGFLTGAGRGRTAGLGRYYFPKILSSDRIVEIQ